MAALHPQLRFGHSVLCQSFRNRRCWQRWRNAPILSGGRFILGIGAGGNAEEYRAYGYGFPPAGVRVEQLEETLQIIKALWTEETATFAGRYYQISAAHCEPSPTRFRR